jgi:apolipoprotein N-acyltransferase
MSPKFYSLLWVLFAVSAGILWLGNVFTMLATVIFGFIAFGLIFTGMMCVLPGTVSHLQPKRIATPPRKKEHRGAVVAEPARRAGFTAYRSA